MDKPVLEVIRFDEADIVTASGMGMGFTTDNFGNGEPNDGIFSFFGGSSGDVSHNAHDENIVSAFNRYFSRTWSSTFDILVCGSYGEERWEESLAVLIDYESYNDPPKYKGTYYLTFNGDNYYFRSN